MLVKVTIEMIAGALVSVQTILYSNGKTVKRVLDMHTGVPLYIIE
jgi:hypothetical protein